MAGKGSRPGERRGGRRKGTPNKATTAASIQAEIAASGELPLDFMMRTMRDPGQDFGMRAAMARSAAPYCHPQLQAVAHRLIDAQGNPVAPVVNLSVSTPKLEDRTAKLRHQGAKDGDTSH
jgi:hypothetical protein